MPSERNTASCFVARLAPTALVTGHPCLPITFVEPPKAGPGPRRGYNNVAQDGSLGARVAGPTLRSRARCVLAALGPGRTSVGSAISIAGNVCPSTGCVGPASRAPRLRTCATCVLAAPGSGWDLGRLRYFDRRTRVSLHGQRGSGFPSPLAPSWVSCVLAAPGSGSHFGRLGEGDPTTPLSGHKRSGCQPCREVEAVVQRLGVTQCRGPGIQTVQSGRRPDVDPGLRSWATCVLAARGSRFCLGRLGERDPTTQRSGHELHA